MKQLLVSVLTLLSIQPLFAESTIPFTQVSKEINYESSRKDFVDGYYTIGEITVSEAKEEEIYDLENLVLERSEKVDIKSIIMVVDQLVALGKKIWPIIEAGKPVANVSMANSVNVLPNVNGANPEFYEMEEWEVPKSKSYVVSYKNLLGVEVIKFTFSVFGQYGGSFNGKGDYLSNVKILARNVSVSWGFTFDAESVLMSIANRGSKDWPIASATFEINYKAESPLKVIKSSEILYIDGNGTIEKL